MNSSTEHKNWLVVGEIINSLKTPVELYTYYIVKGWHQQLVLNDCVTYGHCASPGNCQQEKKPKNLCRSCNGWHGKLESSHLNPNKSQIRWRQNCTTSRWPLDAWEMAKFFMSPLGDNKSTVKDAKSTDLSSLLNVLEWMGNVSFCGHARVDRGLVQALRSDVSNGWAHAPNQEMTAHQLNNAFGIVKKFLDDLEKVFTDEAVKKCREDVQWLQTNEVTNVAEAELNNLLLLRQELGHDVTKIKEDIKSLKEDQKSDQKTIEEQEKMLKDLEDYTRQCCDKMEEFQQWKEHIDKLFRDVKKEFENFQDETKKNIMEIREDIKELQDQAKGTPGERKFKIESCIPQKLQTFTGRDNEVDEIMSLFEKKENVGSPGIVAIIGEPGFGKSTIAVEVSHRIKEKDIPVIFSYLSNTFTVDEVVRRLCLDIGILSSDDPMSSLTVWLKGINEKAVLVMDKIEQLQQGGEGKEFNDLLRLILKNSKNLLQIIATSTTSLKIPDLEIEECSVNVMERESSINLLRKCCTKREIQQHHLQVMATLCGDVPLALRLVAFRLETDDPDDLVTWLKDMPMEAMETAHVEAKLKSTIKKSFEMLEDKEKKSFVRLAIIPGNFNRDSASHVTELGAFQTSNTLRLLVRRSLLQKDGTDDKYTMHPLIRRFLNDHSKEFEGEQAKAKRLMLEFYLKKSDDLTKLYWQKDGYKKARNALKDDSHNVEEVLKLCDEATREENTMMVDTLVKSDIYKSLSRFFYNFVLEVLSPAVVETFLQNCVNISKVRGDFAAVVNFQCLVAEEKRRKSWKSQEYEDSVKTALGTYNENKELEHNDDVKSHFSYCYGRYLCNLDRYSDAMKYGQVCYKIRKNKEKPTSIDKVDQVIALQLIGMINMRAWKNERDPEAATEHFNEAISISEECLGSHELTASSYKKLADCHLFLKENQKALECYRKAYQIRNDLGLTNNNVAAFNLLRNLGNCLEVLGEKKEALLYLTEACSLLERLPDEDQARIKTHRNYRFLEESLESLKKWEATENGHNE